MDQKQKNVLLLAVTAVLLVGSWLMFWPLETRITQGLDIRGGLSVILTAKETSGTPVTASDMERAETIVRNRVDGLGVKEPSIQRQGNVSLLIQIPGAKNPEEALRALGETGRLEFVDVGSITDSQTVLALTNGEENVRLKDGTYSVIEKDGVQLTGGTIRSATVSQNSQDGKIEVSLVMDSRGAKVWADYTTKSVGKQVAVVLDGTVKSAPSVNEPILDGQTAISGSFTAEEAKSLKTVLESGALPVTLIAEESRIVGPTLGQDSLRQGVTAALIGLALVCVYVTVFYRGLGLITVVSLVTFTSFFLGILALMSRLGVFSLTLPGIAGIVLTIGVAADSSILILERFKEEVRMGKTVRSAANSGSQHGMFTSIDADLVTLVTAQVLYWAAIGPVKGFALTLSIGIVCDIAMMVLLKRPIIVILGESVFTKMPAFWGLPKAGGSLPAKTSKGGGAL